MIHAEFGVKLLAKIKKLHAEKYAGENETISIKQLFKILFF